MVYAIYYELVDGDTVNQALFVPAVQEGSRSFPPLFYTRELSEALPNRRWTMVSSSAFNPNRLVLDPVDLAVDQFSGISHQMRSTLSRPSYTLRGYIVVPLTDTDVVSLMDDHNKLPTTIQTRISTLRERAKLAPLPGRSS